MSARFRNTYDLGIGELGRPEWHQHANCRGMGTDAWFGNPAGAPTHLCATCPVRDVCGDSGSRELFGVWGGRGAGGRQITPQGVRPSAHPRPLRVLTPEQRTAMYQLAALAAQVLREAAA